MLNELWKLFEFKKTLLYSKVVDFEFLGNFCIDHFLFKDILVSKL